MKSHLVFDKPYTFDYYKPVFSFAADGETLVIDYPDAPVRRRGLILPAQGGTFTLTSDVQMEIDSEIRNVRDSEGTEVFVVNGQPYNLFVTAADPVFDVYGRLISWKHHLMRAVD